MLEWQLGDIADDASLIVSELVTNAILATRAAHRRDPVRMWMLGSQAGVLFLIWDATTPAPVRRVAAADAEHGRGLTMVDAVSDRWGSYRVGGQLDGKVMWALAKCGQPVRRVSVFPLVRDTRGRNRAPVAPGILARVKAALERLPSEPTALDALHGRSGDVG